jgi:phycocyanobilin:ferredoxin oxidoreductase
MTSEIWDALIQLEERFVDELDYHGHRIHEEGMDRFNQPGWINLVWDSKRFRRAHIDVVDARKTRGLWMMHCCIFPYTDDASPIFGFDVIAGKNKITGAFLDFSSTGNLNHPMIDWFGEEVKKLEWRKTRELPEWAKRIFSPHMVAAGNIVAGHELEQIVDMAYNNFDHYIKNVGDRGSCLDNSKGQDFYCENQRQNPHTPKVMASLGLNEDDIKIFIEECLFPPIR